jgi:hypothetical protein
MVVGPRVGPCFWIERRLYFMHVPAETLDHLADHMVVKDADAVSQQLHREVTVAQVPGDAHHLALVMSMNLKQLLRPRADAYYACIHSEPVAFSQPCRSRQIKHDLPAPHRAQYDPSPIPAVEIHQHAVYLRCGIPGAGREDGLGAHQKRK